MPYCFSCIGFFTTFMLLDVDFGIVMVTKHVKWHYIRYFAVCNIVHAQTSGFTLCFFFFFFFVPSLSCFPFLLIGTSEYWL